MEILPDIIVAERPAPGSPSFAGILPTSATVTAGFPEFIDAHSRAAMPRAELRRGETWETFSYLALWLGAWAAIALCFR